MIWFVSLICMMSFQTTANTVLLAKGLTFRLHILAVVDKMLKIGSHHSADLEDGFRIHTIRR
jgi:hypothetical protein